MALEDKISGELKSAMKAGEKIRLSSLRMLLSAIKNKKIENGTKELDDEAVLTVIQKMVKQHKESIAQFRKGGREDLVAKEEEEMSFLEVYLPEQLSEEELEGLVKKAIEGTGAASAGDMGKVMKELMGQVKGRADGKLVSDKVRELLK